MIKIANEKKGKKIFEAKGTCTHCGKKLIIKKTRTILKESVPAEVEEKVTIEKDSQTVLPQIEDPKKANKDKK